MVKCPKCDAVMIDLDEDDLDEGDTLTCDECGIALSVSSVDPLELEMADDEDEEDDEEDEDFEYDEDEDEEEEEEEEEDWH